MLSNYTAYHVHSHMSLLDSCTDFKDYVDMAVKLGQKAIASTEHGKPLKWVEKKMYCDKMGVKFIHGVEMYLTEALEVLDPETGEFHKVRDNYHTVLLARNQEGIRELNSLVSLSCQPDHFYFSNRITFDEFLGISNNIIKTSACLASPLNKLPIDHPYYERLIKAYDYLEVQPHSHPEQVSYNVHLASLSSQYGIPLIAGTDTHSLNDYKAKCRSVLLKAKRKSYGDEDAFDMTYQTYDSLVEAFKKQGALPEKLYLAAIENTNIMADSIEDWELDTSLKYPILYGTRENDHAKLVETIEQKLADKLARGIIPAEQEGAFRQAIEEELRVFTKVEMDGFMLSMSELISWCKENGIPVGPARGSVGGSRIAYVTDIIDLNPETWHTVFSRFCNEDRKEVGDIDVDVIDTDRPRIFEYIIGRFGVPKTARVPSFGTLVDKSVIDEIGRALMFEWNEKHGLKFDDKTKDNPYNYDVIARVKKEFLANGASARKAYPEIFECFDGLVGTKVSQSVHPAGIVISPITLADNYGVFDKDGEQCLMIDMDEIHECGLVKYDLLILKNIGIIKEACEYIGIPYPRTDQIDWNDQAVWEDMMRSPVGIFQFEGEFAHQMLRQYKPRSIFDITLVTACIRPSGASYRNDLIARKPHHNPSTLIDELLAENNGYLVYQEDIIKFLQEICGLSGSEADTVRRGIARKKEDLLAKMIPIVLDGYCDKSDKPRNAAIEEAKQFLKIIEDASSYMFGYNHAIAYSLISFICAWLRKYHPLEFITAYLNNAANDDDIVAGSELAREYGIQIVPPRYGISTDRYFFDKDRNVITKGVGSIRDLNNAVSRELFELSKTHPTTSFMELLRLIKEHTTLRSNQLDHLIKIDYFADFGNVPTLTRIYALFDFFKQGDAIKMKKTKVSQEMVQLIQPYATDKNAKGKSLLSYTITNMNGLLAACEEHVRKLDLPDLDIRVKIENAKTYLGYIGIQTNEPEDRCRLIICDVWPLIDKKSGIPWAYRLATQSLGTGKTASLSVYANVYNKMPISKGDIIRTTPDKVKKNAKGYWYLYAYTRE